MHASLYACIHNRAHCNWCYYQSDEGIAAILSENNHLIAIFRTKENYEDLQIELQDIINEINTFKTLS